MFTDESASGWPYKTVCDEVIYYSKVPKSLKNNNFRYSPPDSLKWNFSPFLLLEPLLARLTLEVKKRYQTFTESKKTKSKAKIQQSRVVKTSRTIATFGKRRDVWPCPTCATPSATWSLRPTRARSTSPGRTTRPRNTASGLLILAPIERFHSR